VVQYSFYESDVATPSLKMSLRQTKYGDGSYACVLVLRNVIKRLLQSDWP